ncbi:hypothetical protein ACGFMO_07815 [Streptomyces niveus]|uniref:hypothetical protein n=1 Tax=Streptomyces niveus TaxID=193462 RepID=UPI00371D5079
MTDVLTTLARDLRVLAECDAILSATPPPDAQSVRRALELIAKHSNSAHDRSLLLLSGQISDGPRRPSPMAQPGTQRRRPMHGRGR